MVNWDLWRKSVCLTLFVFLAASKGFDEIAGMLLKNGANPNIQDKSGSTPLHRASAKGFVGIGRLLLSHGGNLEIQDIEGYTPMVMCLNYDFKC
jgi:ankyrin repeat protein